MGLFCMVQRVSTWGPDCRRRAKSARSAQVANILCVSLFSTPLRPSHGISSAARSRRTEAREETAGVSPDPGGSWCRQVTSGTFGLRGSSGAGIRGRGDGSGPEEVPVTAGPGTATRRGGRFYRADRFVAPHRSQGRPQSPVSGRRQKDVGEGRRAGSEGGRSEVSGESSRSSEPLRWVEERGKMAVRGVGANGAKKTGANGFPARSPGGPLSGVDSVFQALQGPSIQALPLGRRRCDEVTMKLLWQA